MKESEWIQTKIDLDTVDWRGTSIHLKEVPAIKNAKTGKIRLYPEQVSLCEIESLVGQYKLNPRDAVTLLTLYAKPGIFEQGYLHTRYHMNKTLFYIWKELENKGLGEAFPHDEFEAAPKGPVPKNLESDLQHLRDRELVSLKMHRWGTGPKDESKVTELTPKGLAVAKEIWERIGEPFKKTIILIKERIFPLDPKTIRERVHRDYPQYKKTYVELDTE